MKNLILILILVTSFHAKSESKDKKVICSLWYASEVKAVAEKNGKYDKFKHCAVSCMLSLRCPITDVMQIGIYKELADVVGPGNAEMKDLAADFDGINLVVRGISKNDSSCMKQCHIKYPECP